MKPTDTDYPYPILNKPKIFYDARGRRTAEHPETKRHLFWPRGSGKTLIDINLWNEDSYFELGALSTRCYKNSKREWVCEDISAASTLKKTVGDECGILGVDYGIIEPDGSMTGGGYLSLY